MLARWLHSAGCRKPPPPTYTRAPTRPPNHHSQVDTVLGQQVCGYNAFFTPNDQTICPGQPCT